MALTQREILDEIHRMPSKEAYGFVRSLWPSIKNAGQSATSGWLAEAWVFSVMKRLEDQGIRTIRGWESSPIDGAWVYPKDGLPGLPPAGTSWLDLWNWADRHRGEIPLLYFDVKYFSLRPTGLKSNPYEYSEIGNKATRKQFQHDTVFFLVFDGLPEHVALVPRDVMKNATNLGTGIEPLVSSAPAWIRPFLVCLDDLATAIKDLLAAAGTWKTWYRNPTSGVVLEGWRPESSFDESLLRPSTPAGQTSLAAIQYFCSQVTEKGWHVEMNPISPFCGDIWLWGPDMKHPLFIEHKSRRAEVRTLRNSPFKSTTHWHFLICSNEGEEEVVCMPRFASKSKWTDGSCHGDPDFEKWRVNSVDDVLECLTTHNEEAVAAADKLLVAYEASSQADLGANALEDIVTSSTGTDELDKAEEDLAGLAQLHVGLSPDEYNVNSDTNDSNAEERDEGGTDTHQSGKHGPEHAWGLPGVAERMNEYFADDGHLVCIPLDPFHPCGNRFIADYTWSQDDKQRYLEHGVLPLKPFVSGSKGGNEVKGVVCRFTDCSGGFGKAAEKRLVMRPVCWAKPVEGQKQFFFLGGALPASMHEEDDLNSLWDPFVLLPSDRTTLFEDGVRTRRGVAEGGSSDCVSDVAAHYFNHVEQRELRAPRPQFSAHNPRPLVKGVPRNASEGDTFMKPNEDPQRYVLSLKKVCEFFKTLLCGDSPAIIRPLLSNYGNRPVQRDDYIESLSNINQFAWNFGLLREPMPRGNVARANSSKKSSRRTGHRKKAIHPSLEGQEE